MPYSPFVSNSPLLLEFSYVLQLFHDRLVHFKNQGVVTGPDIVYVESAENGEHRNLKRRRKDEHKQELAAIAIDQTNLHTCSNL